MNAIRRFFCWLLRLVLFEEHQRVMVFAAKQEAVLRAMDETHARLREELRAVKQLHDPREHIASDVYAKLEEKYDVLYRRNLINVQTLERVMSELREYKDKERQDDHNREDDEATEPSC